MGINNKIFVYGTLIDNFLNGYFPGIDLYIKEAGIGEISGRLFDLGEYPGAKLSTGHSKKVTGRIYEITPAFVEKVLSTLDDYEQYDSNETEGSLFIRKITSVIDPNGNFCEAWVYWYNKPVQEESEILTGDYKKYLSENKLTKDALK